MQWLLHFCVWYLLYSVHFCCCCCCNSFNPPQIQRRLICPYVSVQKMFCFVIVAVRLKCQMMADKIITIRYKDVLFPPTLCRFSFSVLLFVCVRSVNRRPIFYRIIILRCSLYLPLNWKFFPFLVLIYFGAVLVKSLIPKCSENTRKMIFSLPFKFYAMF